MPPGTAEIAYSNILPAYRRYMTNSISFGLLLMGSSVSKHEQWRIKALAFHGLVKRVGVVDYVRTNSYRLDSDDLVRLVAEFPPLLRVVDHMVRNFLSFFLF